MIFWIAETAFYMSFKRTFFGVFFGFAVPVDSTFLVDYTIGWEIVRQNGWDAPPHLLAMERMAKIPRRPRVPGQKHRSRGPFALMIYCKMVGFQELC